MSSQTSRTSIATSIGRLTASLAMAAGCMFGSIEASTLPHQQVPSAHVRSAFEPHVAIAHRQGIQEVIDASRNMFRLLDSITVAMNNPDELDTLPDADVLFSQIAQIREIEARFDKSLTEQRAKGFAIEKDLMKCRKLIAQSRFRIGLLAADLKRLQDDVQRFDSDMNLDSMRFVADARTTVMNQRFH